MLSKLVVLVVLFGVMQLALEAVGIMRIYPLEIPKSGFRDQEALELARAKARIDASNPITQWIVANIVGIRVQHWDM
ncbi:MAG: hypothetical protein QM754_13925 [Tepidisphaeraceae bacterium]